MKYAPLFLILAATACAHGPMRPAPSEMAFPFGTYQHKVTAIPKRAPNPKPVEVGGVVQSGQHDLRVVGLSPVGSTVFRIHEDLCEHTTEKEFYIDEMKKHEDSFMELYQMIKAALFARKDTPDFTYRGAHIRLSKPDEKSIPRLIEVQHPYIDLNIEVTGYEVAK